MINKVYEKVKEYLKKIDFLFVILVIVMIFTFIEFPYYISAPGGLVNLDKKVIIDGEYKSKGSLNMTYVTEYKPNIFMLLYAYLNPYVDIEKASDYLMENDTDKNLVYRQKLELKEAVSSAIIYGYQKASRDVIINKEDIYVTYILPEANTDIVVGDIIRKIDDEEIYSKKDINTILANKNIDERLEILVENNGKTYTRYASKTVIENVEVIGLLLTVDYTYEVNPKVKFKFKSNESGPSGGFMTALEIYNELTSEDITKGYKIAGTGTIDIDGVVGPIGGVKYKLRGAVKNKADIFLVPAGENYEEAIKEKEVNNYKINIISIENFDQALLYLDSLNDKMN